MSDEANNYAGTSALPRQDDGFPTTLLLRIAGLVSRIDGKTDLSTFVGIEHRTGFYFCSECELGLDNQWRQKSARTSLTRHLNSIHKKNIKSTRICVIFKETDKFTFEAPSVYQWNEGFDGTFTWLTRNCESAECARGISAKVSEIAIESDPRVKLEEYTCPSIGASTGDPAANSVSVSSAVSSENQKMKQSDAELSTLMKWDNSTDLVDKLDPPANRFQRSTAPSSICTISFHLRLPPVSSGLRFRTRKTRILRTRN